MLKKKRTITGLVSVLCLLLISVNGFEKKKEGYAYFAGDDIFLGEDKKNIDIQ